MMRRSEFSLALHYFIYVFSANILDIHNKSSRTARCIARNELMLFERKIMNSPELLSLLI